MSVADTWHTFMIRKTLLTHWSVCFEFSAPNTTFHDSIIRDTAASSLFVDLVSVLDEAIEARMASRDYARGVNMKNRLEMLAKSGCLLDHKVLKAIHNRRNEIGHEFEQGATVQELEEAINKVRDQLESWQLIRDVDNYELEFERSAARNSEEEDVAFEQDLVIRVKAGGIVWSERKQTKRFGRLVN